MPSALEPFAQFVFNSSALQIICSTGELFDHFESSGDMWNATGDREVCLPFVFRDPFQATPAVTLNIIGMDSDQGFNLRYRAMASRVTKMGFDLVFATWGDTRIARTTISWQAVGLNTAPSKKEILKRSQRVQRA